MIMKLLTLLAHRYVAGDTRADAFRAVRRLHKKGITATLDLLGENVLRKAKAENARDKYVSLLKAVHEENLDANISVKLTQLGLDISTDYCMENFEVVLKVAKELKSFVWIDMESAGYTDRTIEIYEHFVRKYGDFMGICIQAALRRSSEDIERLMHLKGSVRLVKGAYKEKGQQAFADKKEVDENYRGLALRLLEAKMKLVMIATHDESILSDVHEWLGIDDCSQANVEFAMLYGVRRDLQEQLAQEGCRVRVYIPFGVQWLPYFLRRLRERKENLWFAVKSLFHR